MDGQKIAVILAVISLIYIIAKLCADTPSEPSVFDSFYEESQDETSAHEDSSSKVKREYSYHFPEYNSDTDEIDDEYEGADYDDYDTNWFDDYEDVLADGVWQQFFTEKPEVLTREEKRAWLDTLKGVALGSDAFFPFGDNIERAHRSGVEFIAQAGGSVRDDHVIETCDKYGIAMAFTGVRLFHH